MKTVWKLADVNVGLDDNGKFETFTSTVVTKDGLVPLDFKELKDLFHSLEDIIMKEQVAIEGLIKSKKSENEGDQ